MDAERLAALLREKDYILKSAQAASFNTADKGLDLNVLNRLQQWRRHRMEEIEKEIAQLKVRAAAVTADGVEHKEFKKPASKRPPTPVPQARRLPTPPALPSRVIDMFDPAVNPLIAELRAQGKKIEVFKQPVKPQATVPGAHYICPDCNEVHLLCKCPAKQWIKRYTADSDIRDSV